MSSMIKSRRSWFAPEIVQTSSMDCGPAVLKCLLGGFGINASYSRLREACQTSVDGTSIDVMEDVVQRLGLDAEQVMLPSDFLFVPNAKTIPAVLITTDKCGITHFIVLWRRVGQWLQIMDPAVGRKWLKVSDLKKHLYLHSTEVESSDWLEWANSAEATQNTAIRLKDLGASIEQANEFLYALIDRDSWLSMAALDAAVRLLCCLREAGGLQCWNQTEILLQSLISQTLEESPCGYKHIPERFWSVKANGISDTTLIYSGAILLRVTGQPDPDPELFCHSSSADTDMPLQLETELASALTEKPLVPMREFWHLIRTEGLLTPVALVLAIGLAMGAVVLEAVLFQGIYDLAANFGVTSQRIFAFSSFILFFLLLWLFEASIVSESFRAGRHLEARMRLLLMSRLPKLKDRYMQSRLVSDVAERSHSVYSLRALPDLAISFLRASWELVFTIIAIGFIAPASLPLALVIGILTVITMVLVQPVISERALRVRSQLGSLQKFYFDALLGTVPIRTHSAERTIRREHESLLVEWARATRSTLTLAVAVQGIRSLSTWLLTGLLLYLHLRSYGVTGDLLLLVYWVLKLPALGEELVSNILEYPAHRSIGLRLLEITQSTHEPGNEFESSTESRLTGMDTDQKNDRLASTSGISIEMRNVQIVAAGHEILRDVNLSIGAGEHVAIVGPSGAGKSSLIGLMLGFHDARKDSILIDGEPLTNDLLVQLRRRTSWVDPGVQIWNSSLLENLRYSPVSGSHSELTSVLESADLTSVVAHLPEGFQSELGEGGAKLSGGEGQRVRLARAMWQRGIGLALLDEPFRGLDKTTRQRHLDATRQHWKDATLLCVTHDISETRSFDRVLVVEDGHIVEDDSPEILCQRPSSRYSELLYLELQVHEQFWSQATLWRRLSLEAGQIHESSDLALS